MEKSKLVNKWYVLNTYSGHEYKIKRLLEERVERLGISDQIVEILVPDEERIEIKKNKRSIVQKRSLPGYILIKIKSEPKETKMGIEYKICNNVWYIIKNTEGVSKFVGTGNVPVPIEDDQVEAIQSRMKRYSSTSNVETEFKIGDLVEIISGSFMGSSGKISDIDLDHMKITVMVEMFNRLTPFEVNFDEIRSL